jgi:hypothetical protein
MALGTGEHKIGGKLVDVRQVQRPVVGAGGMVSQGLSVAIRGSGGYTANTPTKNPGANLRTDTLLNRPKLKVGPAPRIRRVGMPRQHPVSDALALRPRVISP